MADLGLAVASESKHCFVLLNSMPAAGRPMFKQPRNREINTREHVLRCSHSQVYGFRVTSRPSDTS